MNRGIDHIVLSGRDLDALASVYERLGFTLTPRAQHPFGTGNQLAQMDGSFLELLSVTQPLDIAEATPGVFSFGAYNRDFLSRGEGVSMIALKSKGWQADRAHFQSEGLDVYEPFEFSRLAGQPDGSEVTVGFKLTFATHPGMPWAVFFTCDHQHESQYFYKPQFQNHANTATAIGEVIMVAEDPGIYAAYFESLIGVGSATRHGESLSVQAGDTMISVIKRSDLFERYPGARLVGEGETRFAGFGVNVKNIEAVEKTVIASGFKYYKRGKSLWLSTPETSDVIVEFIETTVAA